MGDLASKATKEGSSWGQVAAGFYWMLCAQEGNAVS